MLQNTNLAMYIYILTLGEEEGGGSDVELGDDEDILAGFEVYKAQYIDLYVCIVYSVYT